VTGEWRLTVRDKTADSENIDKWILIIHGNDTSVGMYVLLGWIEEGKREKGHKGGGRRRRGK
jgi:hypothetical protein